MSSFISALSGTVTSNTARLGYENLLENGTVTVSSENTDFPIENAYDWLPYDVFKPAAIGTINIDLTLTASDGANYFAFYGLENVDTIKLQYWDGSAYQDAFTAIAPPNTGPYIKFFDTQTTDQWRVVIVCTTICSVAQIAFGSYLALPFGQYLNYTEPKLGRSNTILTNTSDTGQFLGRSVIANASRSTVKLNYATDAFTRASWLPFVEHAETKPFFYAWDVANYPTEAAYCWADGDIDVASHDNYGTSTATMSIRALIE